MRWSSRKRILVGAIGLALLWLTYTLWRDWPVETGITLAKARLLRKGMTYEEVLAVMGCAPGWYNEASRTTDPPRRHDKGRHITMEDADLENVSLNTAYEHVDWADYRGVRVKVMFTKDTRRVHRVDTYRYVPEENAFRYADE